MNTKRSFFAILLLLTLILASCATSGRPETDTVLLLHTNDLHSAFLPDGRGRGGLARIAGYVDAERDLRPDVLYLDAGDAVTGNPASTIFAGRPVFFVLNMMGLDAMALGNHEFDHGAGLIEDYRRIATFPILAANAMDEAGEPVADAEAVLLDIDGVRVALIGLITEKTPVLTAGGKTAGVTFLDPTETVAGLLVALKAHSDLVVVLSHLGHKEDLALAAAVRGVDVIVGGHSHTAVSEPVRVGETLIVQAGSKGRHVGRLELTVELETGRVLTAVGTLVPVNDLLPRSGRVDAVIAEWEQRVAGRVAVRIGHADEALDGRALKPRIEAIFKAVLGTDLGFQNPGGIRATLDAGPILARAIWNMLPFDNTLSILEVRGADLPDHILPYVKGLEPERIYTVGTNSYVADHPEQYFPKGVVRRTDTAHVLRETVLDWVKKFGSLDPPVSSSPKRGPSRSP